MKPKANLWILLSCASVLAGAMTYSAHAANQTWNGGGADANWNTTNNWLSGTGVPGDTTGGLVSTDVATFNAAIANTWGASGSPILIDSASQNLGGISFDTAADSYFIGNGGNSLLLSSGGSIQILSTLTAVNRTETINAPLVIEGAGGTYTLLNNSANGTGAGAGTLNIGGGITGGAAGATVLTLDGSNANANTIGGIIADGTATPLGITKNGTGTWNLTGANTFTGPVAVNSGTLAFGAVTLDSVAQPAQTLTLDNTATLIVGSGDGVVNLNEPGLAGTGTVNLVGVGTKNLTSLGSGFSGNIVIASSAPAAATPDPGGAQVTVNLNGANAFGSGTGTTTITNSGTGIIFLNHMPGPASPLTENFVINAGSGLVSWNAQTVFNTIQSGNIQINSGTLLLNNGGYGTTHSGIISGPGKISCINPGSVLTGANTFSGGYWMGLGNDPAIWTGTYGITQGVTVGGDDTVVGGVIQSGPLGTGTLHLSTATRSFNGTGRVADNGQASTTLHTTVIQRNAVSIVSQPGGTAAANNPNTMTFTDVGLTVPSTWTLEPCVNVYSPVAVDLVNGIPGLNGSTLPHVMGISVGSGALYTAVINEVIGENMLSQSGHMTLRKIGLGTLVLGRVNTYGGDTMAMQGTLKLGVDNALPTGTTLLVGGGLYYAATWPELGLVTATNANPLGTVNFTGNSASGTLDLNGFNQTVAGVGQSFDTTVATANTVTSSSGTSTFTVNNAVDNYFGGTISGNLNLVKNGSGKLPVGVASYSGNTTVNVGILSLGSANANNAASTVTIASSGATLDLSFSGTTTVDTLFIGAVQQAAGVYGPSATSISQITSSAGGTLTVVHGPTPPPFSGSWASLPGGVPTFAIPSSVLGATYTLYYKNNVTDPTWTALTGSGTGTGNGGTLTLSDPTPVLSLPAHRFYRLARNP